MWVEPARGVEITVSQVRLEGTEPLRGYLPIGIDERFSELFTGSEVVVVRMLRFRRAFVRLPKEIGLGALDLGQPLLLQSLVRVGVELAQVDAPFHDFEREHELAMNPVFDLLIIGAVRPLSVLVKRG